MRLTNDTSTEDVLEYARDIENRSTMRKSTFSEADAMEVLRHAQKARDLAISVQRTIRLVRTRAKPTKYGWSGWRYLRWAVVAKPDGDVRLYMEVVRGAANDKSFDGIACSVEGVESRKVLWLTDRQHQRVLRWDDVTRSAIQGLALLLLTLLYSVVW